MRAGTHIDLSFWCKSRCFACTKQQVVSGTLRALLYRSISRCFASKNHRWGLQPIEPSTSGANHAVVHAQNEWSCLGPLETCYSGPEFAVLHEKTTGGVLDPEALVILMLATLFCMHKTTRYVWDPLRLVFQELITEICMDKTSGEVWVQYRLVILLQKALFWMQKPQRRAGTHRDM